VVAPAKLDNVGVLVETFTVVPLPKLNPMGPYCICQSATPVLTKPTFAELAVTEETYKAVGLLHCE